MSRTGIDRERIELVARLYATNQAACQVLDIALQSFSRLCRNYGIETPYARRRRQRQKIGRLA